MNPRVDAAMTATVVSISPDSTLDEACSLMLRHNVSGLPVVDSDEQVVGIVTERDLITLLFEPDKGSHCVSEYLSDDVVKVTVDDLLTDAAELFLKHSFRRVPVVRGHRLVGILSRRDVIRFVQELRMRVRGEKKIRNSLPRREINNLA